MQAQQLPELHIKSEMFDSEKIVKAYEHWFETEAGQFAFAQEKRLIQYMVSAWPRRKQSLLDIGCGTGVFLELFWHSGFDVYGIDASGQMLARVREKMGNKADLHLGKAECLPFDDNEFDFSAMINVLEFCPEPMEALQEAYRVTKKGILICFLNKNSLYYLKKKTLRASRTGILTKARWFSHNEIIKMINKTMGPKKTYSLSVLPGSKSMWKDHWLLRPVNRLFLPPCAGSFIATRVELLEDAPLRTPLMAFEKEMGAN
ncbi:MAG: class I SAM-dependent methyltransferase [Desulfonatronovibrio sp.]